MFKKFITLTCGAMFAFATTAQGDQVFATANVNIRTNPEMDAEVISYLPEDAVAEVIETDENDWWYIVSGDYEGWVSKVYLTYDAPEAYTEIVTHAPVNVRVGTSDQSELLEVLADGETAELLEDLGSHAKIVTDDGTYGYVDARYVSYESHYKTAYKEITYVAEYEDEEVYYSDDWYENDYGYNELTQTTDYADETTYDEEWDELEDAYEEPEYYTPDNYMSYEYYEADYTSSFEEDEAEYEYTPAETEAVYYEDYSEDYSSGVGKSVANLALSYVGYPYVWGGSDTSVGFDCSGLVYYCFAQCGVSVPRVASDQAYGGTQVSLDNLQVGDLVYYYSPVSHIAIYIGGGQVVHSANSSTGVIISDMYYNSPMGAVRY